MPSRGLIRFRAQRSRPCDSSGTTHGSSAPCFAPQITLSGTLRPKRYILFPAVCSRTLQQSSGGGGGGNTTALAQAISQAVASGDASAAAQAIAQAAASVSLLDLWMLCYNLPMGIRLESRKTCQLIMLKRSLSIQRSKAQPAHALVAAALRWFLFELPTHMVLAAPNHSPARGPNGSR